MRRRTVRCWIDADLWGVGRCCVGDGCILAFYRNRPDSVVIPPPPSRGVEYLSIRKVSLACWLLLHPSVCFRTATSYVTGLIRHWFSEKIDLQPFSTCVLLGHKRFEQEQNIRLKWTLPFLLLPLQENTRKHYCYIFLILEKNTVID